VGIEITQRGDRGFHQYSEPVRSAYGDMVEVYESSSARGPHCWLRIYDDGQSSITDREPGTMAAHLTLEQATAIRDRLTAFIDEASQRWDTT
jgi:hypothetical protein